MIPVLKALIAHYREDPAWADVRPPVHRAAGRGGGEGGAPLAETYGFRLEFPVAA